MSRCRKRERSGCCRQSVLCPALDARVSQGLTACPRLGTGGRREQCCDLGQDLKHDRPWYHSSDIPNVLVADASHPCTHGCTPTIEPCARMPLGMPREQDMIVEQRLG